MNYHEPSVVFNLGTETKLTDFKGVVAHAKTNSDSISILPSNQASALRHQLKSTCEVNLLGKVPGANYSKGRNMELVIIRSKCIDTPKASMTMPTNG
jgi:hypothetical protein